MPLLQTLANGLRIATDLDPAVRSCSIGLWVEVGSKHERAQEAGLAHFTEHMLFKGTPRYNALELSDELNRLGGQVNAHTSQEIICLHARCVDEKAPRVLDLLSEMLLESLFPEPEMERERRVILEEYKMYEDNPEDVVGDLFYATLWPSSPLGRPVIGRPETISKFSLRAIRSFLSRELDPSRVVVAIAGNCDRKACMKIIGRRFGKLRLPKRRKPVALGSTRNSGQISFVPKPVEQAHFCLGAAGPHRRSEDRFAFGLMNMVLGGGMSSRLFKEVREKRGLVYSIYSFAQLFHGAGSFGVSGSTSPETFEEVLTVCGAELRRLIAEDVPLAELHMAKEQALDSLLMSVESTMSRMTRLAESVLTFGRPMRIDETIKEIKAVTPAAIRRVANEYLAGQKLAGAFVGPKGLRWKKAGQIHL